MSLTAVSEVESFVLT